ncbi:MAG TPA: diaminopimelate epimerase, partial [Mycobacterium sp.]|nr:diaminopimelate epimerase [Mycobacterium sp.]
AVGGLVQMRVHERGVGETRSCGTGTVAAAVAALADAGADTGTLTVRVAGGDVVVTITNATSYLRGPSVLVARGEIADAWWSVLG